MDIRSSLDGLKTILGVTPAAEAPAQGNRVSQPSEGASLTSDRATLSSAGSQIAQTAAEGGVRTEKVAEIQSSLAAGTYNVPASAVASKMVDTMLARGQ